MPASSLALLADGLPEARRVRFYRETDGESLPTRSGAEIGTYELLFDDQGRFPLESLGFSVK